MGLEEKIFERETSETLVELENNAQNSKSSDLEKKDKKLITNPSD